MIGYVTVHEFFEDKDRQHIPMDQYKTFGRYGWKGFWMHAAQRRAAELLDEIIRSAPELLPKSDKTREYFLQCHPVSVASCLRYVSRVLGLDTALKVTWLRKMYARMARKHDVTTHKGLEGETAEQLFAKVAYTNKHSEYVADTVYAKLTPAEDAMLAQHNFLRLQGKPVNFPTDDEWKELGPPIGKIIGETSDADQGDADDEPEDQVSDEEDDDEIAAALFGGSDEHVLVDDVAADGESPFDIDPADYDKDEWKHIIAICDGGCDEALVTLEQNDAMSPMRAAHESQDNAKAAIDSAKSVPTASSQCATGNRQSLGKHTRRLQRRISAEKKDKKKVDEKRNRDQKKLRKQTAMSDDMSPDSRPSGKKKTKSAASSKDMHTL